MMMTKAEEKLYNEIMQGQRPQDRVDAIVEKTKMAMEICQQESWQAKVDRWIANA